MGSHFEHGNEPSDNTKGEIYEVCEYYPPQDSMNLVKR
jgi:hypothetical protein